MKTKQKSVRVFEINSDNYDKVVGLIESKSILLKKYLLLVKTNNEKIKEYFKTKNLEVRFVSKDFNGINDKLDIAAKQLLSAAILAKRKSTLFEHQRIIDQWL